VSKTSEHYEDMNVPKKRPELFKRNWLLSNFLKLQRIIVAFHSHFVRKKNSALRISYLTIIEMFPLTLLIISIHKKEHFEKKRTEDEFKKL